MMPKVHNRGFIAAVHTGTGPEAGPLTGGQLSVLLYAGQREPGLPWAVDRAAAEECCTLGLLQAAHLDGADPGHENSVVYELTDAGRDALLGRREA